MQNLPALLTPDFGLLFWMLLAFIVVFVILKRYGFPAIIKMVEERKNFIDESLKNAREANEKLTNIRSESEALLKQAREQQAEIIKEAMATRDKIINEARAKAQTEGTKLLEEAKAQISTEKENALQDIHSQVAELSVLIAEKILRHQLNKDSEQEKFIERMLDDTKRS